MQMVATRLNLPRHHLSQLTLRSRTPSQLLTQLQMPIESLFLASVPGAARVQYQVTQDLPIPAATTPMRKFKPFKMLVTVQAQAAATRIAPEKHQRIPWRYQV